MKIGRLEIRIQSPIIITFDKTWMREVKQALREGKTLLAVKIYKDHTGKSLMESKNYVCDVLRPKYYKENNTMKKFREEMSKCTLTSAQFQAKEMVNRMNK
jgi:ribosomal protein L7/L12